MITSSPPPHGGQTSLHQHSSHRHFQLQQSPRDGIGHDLPPFDFELPKFRMSGESPSQYLQMSPQSFPHSSPHSYSSSSASSAARSYGFSVSHPSVKVNHNLSYLLHVPPSSSVSHNTGAPTDETSMTSSTSTSESCVATPPKRSGFRERSLSLKEASETRPQVLSVNNSSNNNNGINSSSSDTISKTVVEIRETVEIDIKINRQGQEEEEAFVEDNDAFAGIQADSSSEDVDNGITTLPYERLKDEEEGGEAEKDKESSAEATKEEAFDLRSTTTPSTQMQQSDHVDSTEQVQGHQTAPSSQQLQQPLPRLTSPGISSLREDSDGDSSFDILDDEQRDDNEEAIGEDEEDDEAQWTERVESLLTDIIEQGRVKEAYFALESLVLEDNEEAEAEISAAEEADEYNIEDEEVTEEDIYEEEESSLLSPEALSEGIMNIEVIINEIGARMTSIIGQQVGDNAEKFESVLFDKSAIDTLNEFSQPLVKSFGFESIEQQISTLLERQHGKSIIQSKKKLLKEFSDLLYDELVLSVLINDVDKQYDIQIQKLQAEQELLQQHINRLENTRRKELARLQLERNKTS